MASLGDLADHAGLSRQLLHAVLAEIGHPYFEQRADHIDAHRLGHHDELDRARPVTRPRRGLRDPVLHTLEIVVEFAPHAQAATMKPFRPLMIETLRPGRQAFSGGNVQE